MDDTQNLIVYPTDSVMKITVVVGAQKQTIDFRTEMKINQNLPEEISKQPGMFAWYSAILADQEDQLLGKKRDMERREADLALQLRQGKLNIKDQTGAVVKLTENSVKDYISNDKQIRALQDEMFALESFVKKFRILVNSSVQRSQMLIQLGLLERQERRQFGQ